MKRKIILSVLSVATVFMVNSCAPNTPAARIAKYPALFENLSSNDKELAPQGKIKKGMHRDGVILAWGKPDRQTEGSRNGKSFEQWVYTTADPVYTQGFHHYAAYGYNRYGYGRYGRHGHRRIGYGVGFGPEVYYVRRTAATVDFDHNGKVTEWVTQR